MVGRRRSNENIADHPRGSGIDQPLWRAHLPTLTFEQRKRGAAARDTGIKHGQIGQPDADTAERHGEPGRFAFRQNQRGTGLCKACREAACADLVEQRDGRNIERHLQRAAHRNGALERHVEIFRRVGAKAHRPVFDQCLGMNEAVFERHPVDERLQRRAR